MTPARASRHHARRWLRTMVKLANGCGCPAVYFRKEFEE